MLITQCKVRFHKKQRQSAPENLGSEVWLNILCILIFEVGQGIETLEEVRLLRLGWALLIVETKGALELFCGVCLKSVC